MASVSSIIIANIFGETICNIICNIIGNHIFGDIISNNIFGDIIGNIILFESIAAKLICMRRALISPPTLMQTAANSRKSIVSAVNTRNPHMQTESKTTCKKRKFNVVKHTK